MFAEMIHGPNITTSSGKLANTNHTRRSMLAYLSSGLCLYSSKRRYVALASEDDDGYTIELPFNVSSVTTKGDVGKTKEITQSSMSFKNDNGTLMLRIKREPTGTMGNYGLDSMFRDEIDFEEKMKGKYRRATATKSAKRSTKNGMYSVEFDNNKLVGVVVGCKGGPNARKFNQLQTITVYGEASDESSMDVLRKMVDSFHLTAGTTCD